jgi:hypothetical protein
MMLISVLYLVYVSWGMKQVFFFQKKQVHETGVDVDHDN